MNSRVLAARNEQIPHELESAHLYLVSGHLRLQKALAHERKVTGLIEQLYVLAVQEHDYAPRVLMQWLIGEQVDEETNATLLVDRLTLIGDNASGILVRDLELAKRAA